MDAFPTAEELARFGISAPWWFAIRHRIRWSECDPFGHANHRAYLEWFEEARNRYLEGLGLPTLSAATPGPVIAEAHIRFHRPLSYAEEILVTARTLRLGRTSFEMEYAAWREAPRDAALRGNPGRDGLAAIGTAVLILLVNATGEKALIPATLRASILARERELREEAPR